MMARRIWNIVWKESRQFVRYRLLLIFVLAFPALNLVSAAGAIGEGIQHIPTAIYDRDLSAASRALVRMLRNTETFDPDHRADSQRALKQLLEAGTAKVGLIIPQGFGSALEAPDRQATIQALLDGTETTTALVAQAYLEEATQVYVREMAAQGSSSGAMRLERVSIRSRAWFNADMDKKMLDLPGEMADSLALLALFLPALLITRERERGTLEQLFVTPVRPIEVIIGKGALAFLVAYVGFLGMLALNVFYYRIPLRGSLILLMILTGYYLLVEMGWGLLISTVARTQGQSLMAAFILAVVDIIFSGRVLPMSYTPRAAQLLSYLTPSRQYTVIMEGVMLKGTALSGLWGQVIALTVLGVVLYALAATRLRKRLD